MVAPSVTNLVPWTPSLTLPYKITSSSQSTEVFRGYSVGAADMKFSVNGVDVTSGIANNGDGSWDYTWPISSLTDGTYTIGAVAVDVLGNRSQPYTIQVTLARSITLVPQNVAGGYNYVNPTGASGSPPPGTLVVELQWDANPEGSVTGYEVLRGATSVCGGQTNLANSCIDTSPPSSGSTVYTVKTWYRDGAGAMQSVSTNYTVTAPAAALATTYWATNSNTVPSTHCYKAIGGAAFRDLLGTAPTGATRQSTVGVSNAWFLCTPTMPAGATVGAGTGSIDVWMTNSTNKSCTVNYFIGSNATSSSGDTVFESFSPSYGPAITVPASVATPTKYTANFTVLATTLVANDQITLELARSCTGITWYYGATTALTKMSLPSLSSGGSSLTTPNAPTGLTVTPNADGTRTLTWTPPSSGTTVDFYRIYRDGTATSARVDTQGVSGNPTESWVDTTAGGTSHTYRVTAASANLAESPFLGPVTG
jgi:hypothetical protein